MARDHKAGGHSEPHAARMGELLSSRHRQKGVSGARQLHSNAVAPVVAAQAQNQASQGRDLSTLASLRALWARTPEPAWVRRAVGEGVKFCPRAGCLSRARPVRSSKGPSHGDFRTAFLAPHQEDGGATWYRFEQTRVSIRRDFVPMLSTAEHCEPPKRPVEIPL